MASTRPCPPRAARIATPLRGELYPGYGSAAPARRTGAIWAQSVAGGGRPVTATIAAWRGTGRTARRQGPFHQRLPHGESAPRSQSGVSDGRSTSSPVGTRARPAATRAQHQPQEAHGLGLRSSSTTASQADRLAREIGPAATRPTTRNTRVEHQLDHWTRFQRSADRPAMAPDRGCARRGSWPWRARSAGPGWAER